MIRSENVCPACGNFSPAPFLPCSDCKPFLEYQAGYETCSICAGDLAGADNPCPDCRDLGIIPLNRLKSLGPWMGPLREWLSLLKYGGDTRSVDWIALQLVEIWNTHFSGIPIVPVPPRRGKIHREGRYTVYLMANALKQKGLPVQHLLIRKDKTPQKTLSRDDRLKGQRLNYKMKRGRMLRGKYVLLDDVSTTRATLSKCATILKNAGADEVFAMVVCRD